MANTIVPPATQFAELLNKDFEQPSRKKQKEYGLKLVKSLFQSVNSGTDSYYSQRNAQWKINDEFAKGKMNPAEFLKFLGIEGNQSYLKIDPTILKVVPRYLQVLLGGFMNRDDRASVNATGVLSYEKKRFRKMQAEYRMKNAQKIAEMQQASGQQHETGYTPEDQDDLEWHYKVVDRLPEESGFEQRVDEVFQNSDDENLKREILSDLAKYGIAVTKVQEINARTRTMANRLRVRRCRPSRVIYNVFEKPNGEDVSLIGEAYPMTIAEARKQFSNITEKEWFTLAQKSARGQNLVSPISWLDRYNTDYTRPYDEFKFMVFDCEVKTADKEYHVKDEKEDRVFLSKKKGRPINPKGEVIEEYRYNIYQGVWAIDTDIMLKWEIAPNFIRPYQNGVDCFSNYSIVCPDADGSLVPALIERGIAVVRRLVDVSLKIQQMTNEMKPDMMAVEISGLRDLDLGNGALQPLQVMKIADQTGKIYWEKQDLDGVPNPEGNQIPFQQIPYSANVAQINTLIGLYNFWLQRLNDEWGTNPDALGQQLPARRGKQVNENQIEMANQATEYIYDFYLMLKRITAQKITMKLWDITIFESADYKEMEDVDIKDLLDQSFDVNIDFVPLKENRQWLERMIELALEKGTISIGEATRIRNMDNIKDAELYLIRLDKKAQEAQAASQRQSIADNAQVQQMSLESKGKIDAQLIQAKAAGDGMVTTAKLELEGYNSIINMVSAVIQESMKSGTPIPANLQPVVDYVIQTTIAKGNPQPQQEAAPEEQGQPQEQPVEGEPMGQEQPTEMALQ